MSIMEPVVPSTTPEPSGRPSTPSARSGAHVTPMPRRSVGLPTRRLDEDLGARDPRWRDVETHVLDVHGTDVLLRRHRPTETGAGRTGHLLVHGLGASSSVWLDVMPLLAADGEVLAVDLPGFGRTAPPAPNAARVEHQVRFVEALLRRLEWDRVVLHGSSMGGLVTALLSARRPDLVEHQVLVAPGIAPPEQRVRRTSGLTYARFVPFLAPPVGRRVLRWAWHREDVTGTHDRTAAAVFGDLERLRGPVRELAIENLALARELPWRVPSFAEAAESLMASWVRAGRTWERVCASRVPTTVVHGSLDRIIDPSVADGLEARLPDVTVHRWEGVGHTPMQECPERYATTVLEQRRR